MKQSCNLCESEVHIFWETVKVYIARLPSQQQMSSEERGWKPRRFCAQCKERHDKQDEGCGKSIGACTSAFCPHLCGRDVPDFSFFVLPTLAPSRPEDCETWRHKCKYWAVYKQRKQRSNALAFFIHSYMNVHARMCVCVCVCVCVCLCERVSECVY